MRNTTVRLVAWPWGVRWVLVTLVSVYVGYIEEQICPCYTCFVPQLLKRYSDDVVGCAQCSRHDLEQYTDYISNFHPALQFTSTIGELELPFVDITLSINGDKLQTSVHTPSWSLHEGNYLQSVPSTPQDLLWYDDADFILWFKTVFWQQHQPQAAWNEINLQVGHASTALWVYHALHLRALKQWFSTLFTVCFMRVLSVRAYAYSFLYHVVISNY